MITFRTVQIARVDLQTLGFQLELVHAPCHLPWGASRYTTHQAGRTVYVDSRLPDGYLAHEVGHALEFFIWEEWHLNPPVDWGFYPGSRGHARRERVALELQKAWSRFRGVDGSGYEGTYGGEDLLREGEADRVVRGLLP